MLTVTTGVVCSAGVGSARGGLRTNLDNYLVAEAGEVTWRDGDADHHQPTTGAGTLVAVAGGVGSRTGDLAATTAVRVLAKLHSGAYPRKPARVLSRYLTESHDRLYARSREQKQVLGASLTTVWMHGASAGWAHVGDSRLYLLRGGRMTSLTAEHTLDELSRRRGRVPEGDADAVIQRFMQGSAGLGDDARIHLEMGLDAGVEQLESGDRLLLCTRGLWESVDAPSLANVLMNVPEAQAAAVACLERAIARGARANLTAIVVRVQ